MSYLEDIRTYDEAMASVSANIEWDMGAREMVSWLEKYKYLFEVVDDYSI